MEQFGRIRSIFFPIHTSELRKFLPMGLMMFFILFTYNILRDTKDTLVVLAAGAEAMSLLKLFGTVPGAIAVFLLYSKLSTIYSRDTMFYLVVTAFISFFGLFAYVIYPNRELFHPSQEWVQSMAGEYPRFQTVFYVIGSWSYGIFYVLSELWGSVVLSLLFWQTANDMVKMSEAKRFYSLFGMLANFGLIGAGLAIGYFATLRDTLPAGVDPWGVTLNSLMGSVVVAGVLLMLVYRWMSKNLTFEGGGLKKEKLKLSLKESFQTLIRSKQLGWIAMIIICYGISINVVEAVWKDQIRKVYGSENAYNAFMGKVTLMTGIVTITFMIIGSNIVRLFGWNVSAKLTPLMIAITGIPFFLFVCFKDNFEEMTLAYWAVTPAAAAVWIGFCQNILAKATKYSLFDPTKEMCYIPLDQESKTRGKAAVDVIGGRLGKSGGAFIQQFLFLLTGCNLMGITPYLGGVLLVAVLLWLLSTSVLNRKLHEPTPQTV